MSPEGRKPQRTCLGCRQVLDQDCLVHYVLSPQGEILVDYRRRLPGRGAYTCPDRGCLQTAVRRGQFARALRAGARADAGQLLAALADQVRERIAGLLGMARKSGTAISGSSLVLESLRDPARFGLVLLAEDITAGIADKVAGKAAASGVPCFRLLDKGRLGQMMGKAERSVVAVRSGPLAESLKSELARYENIAGEC